MSNDEKSETSKGSEEQESPPRTWDSLSDERVEFGLLQLDIVGHSHIDASDRALKMAKDRFRAEIEGIAFYHNGKLFSWAGDGGCFMFLTGDGEGFNTLVRTALEMLGALPAINKTIRAGTDLQEDFRVRISCDYGTARYDRDPSKMHAGFINSFLKHERWIAVPDTVCITEGVRNQLNATLRERFEVLRYSPEMGIDIYQLREEGAKNQAGSEPDDESAPIRKGPSFSPPRKRSTTYPNWTFILIPFLCIMTVLVWRIEDNVIGLIVVPAMLLLSIVIALHKSKRESTKGQSLIRSLLKDELLPNEDDRPLVFHARVLIVADIAEKGSFFRSLEREFERVDESIERNLIFVPVTCDDSDPKAQEERLGLKLEGASAVVVVRTKELEARSWPYEYIDSWAYQRSEIPIVFTKLNPRDCKSQIPKRYFSIPLHAKSLPWRLLQRTNERGFEWRAVARFNRVAVGTCLLIVLTSALMLLAMLPRQRRERQDLLANNIGDLTQAKATIVKKQFDSTALDLKRNYIRMLKYTVDKDKGVPVPTENELQVSYWFNFENQARQFASTENRLRYRPFDVNKASAIGNAFLLRNHVTQANIENRQTGKSIPIRIWRDSDDELFDPEAFMHEEEYRTIRSIVCGSHTGVPETEVKYTVGICVFTETDKPIFRNEYRRFLREEVRTLYERARPHIEKGELTPLPK